MIIKLSWLRLILKECRMFTIMKTKNYVKVESRNVIFRSISRIIS